MPLKTPGPDRLEKGLRVGFGALFGFFVGLAVVGFGGRPTWFYVVGFGIPIALCSWLAFRYGDDFWKEVSGWMRHWWPRK